MTKGTGSVETGAAGDGPGALAGPEGEEDEEARVVTDRSGGGAEWAVVGAWGIGPEETQGCNRRFE